MDKYSTRKHLQSFVVVLEYVRAVLAKSEALSERSEFARMAAYQRAKWVEIGACSCIRPVYRGCVSLHCVSADIWLKLLFQITCYILRNWIRYGVQQRLRRSVVLWDNLSVKYIRRKSQTRWRSNSVIFMNNTLGTFLRTSRILADVELIIYLF